jgi:hypothetical protein
MLKRRNVVHFATKFNSVDQGRIKGFVGPRHFSSEGPFENWKSIAATTLYSRLSGLMEGGGYIDTAFEKHR